MNVTHRGDLSDPRSLQASLRKRNADLRAHVLDETFQGSGNLDLWMSKARAAATQAALYQAGVALDAARLRNDPADTRQADLTDLAAEDARGHNAAASLLDGSAGLGEWFKRAQQVGFVAAAHAARAAEHCDAATVEPVSKEIQRGLEAALASSSGSGNVKFWADHTGDAVVGMVRDTRMTRLAQVAGAAAPAPAGTPGQRYDAVGASLSRERERMLSTLGNLAFGPLPASTGEGLQTALVTGARVLEHSGRVSLAVADLRDDLQAPDDPTLSSLSAQADAEIGAAGRLGLQGSGTAQYWLECTAVIAGRAAAHAALVASHCNAGLAGAVRPQIERLLGLTPSGPEHDPHAAMKRAEAAAYAVIPAVEELDVELRAASVAQRTLATASADDAGRLQVEKARQQARLDLWEASLQRRAGQLSQTQTRINQLSAQIEPLKVQLDKHGRIDKTARLAALGGLAGMLGGALISAASSPAGLMVGALGLATAIGAGVTCARNSSRAATVTAERKALEARVDELAPDWVVARDLSALARTHREEAANALHAIDSQLDVHKMADSLNHPAEGNVEVDEDTVRIGNVVIRRNRVSSNDRPQVSA